jgi:hypothetical protein
MAIEFDGATARIDFASPAALDDIWDGGGAITFWYEFDTVAADDRVFDKRIGGSGWILTMESVTPTWRFYIDRATADGDWRSTVAISLSRHHFALVYNADLTTNDPIMYLDGSPLGISEAITPVGARASDAATSLGVGGANTLASIDGRMEDVRVFPASLTQAQVQQVMGSPLAAQGTETGWWTFREANNMGWADGAVLGASNTLPDKSGGGNLGTPTNSPVARRAWFGGGGARMIMMNYRRLLDDLKRGLVPPEQMRRRLERAWSI